MAARRVSLAPINRANVQSRSMSWRNGSLHWGRLTLEGTITLLPFSAFLCFTFYITLSFLSLLSSCHLNDLLPCNFIHFISFHALENFHQKAFSFLLTITKNYLACGELFEKLDVIIKGLLFSVSKAFFFSKAY